MFIYVAVIFNEGCYLLHYLVGKLAPKLCINKTIEVTIKASTVEFFIEYDWDKHPVEYALPTVF